MLDLFSNKAEFKAVWAGSSVFKEGDFSDAMYVVLEGEVELYMGGKWVETLGPREIVCEMALIDSAPRVATGVARTPCKLAPVPQRRFLFMVQQTPCLSLHIMKAIAERLRKMDRRL